MRRIASLVLLVFGIIGTSQVFAFSNPLMRECRLNQGDFEAYPLPGTTNDMPLCRWNGVIVDAETLTKKLDGQITQAASFILNDRRADSCFDAGLAELPLPTGEAICTFGDGSRLSAYALKAGLADVSRAHLKEVLSAR